MSLHRKTQSSSNLVIEEPFVQRQWLKRRGKDDRLQFSDEMIRRLKDYFSSLDQDSSASISSNELEDPLLLFGLCQNRQDVEDVFKCICSFT
jgi:Ca2+-binding EF-hand superfamily protein